MDGQRFKAQAVALERDDLQILDEAREVPHLFVRAGQRLRRIRREPVDDRLQPALERRERRPQLVRDVVHEPALP